MSRNQRSSMFGCAAIFGGLLLGVIGCTPPAPPCTVTSPILGGSYAQKSQAVTGSNPSTLPSTAARDKSMTVDRKAGVVRFSYLRQGKQVVETWRIDEQ